MNKRLILLAATALVTVSASASADDKTLSFPPSDGQQGNAPSKTEKQTTKPIDQQKLKAERDKAKADRAKMRPNPKSPPQRPRQIPITDEASSDPYGTAPERSSQGAPLVSDFDRKGQSQPKALPDKAARQKALKYEGEQLQGGFGPPAGRAEKAQ